MKILYFRGMKSLFIGFLFGISLQSFAGASITWSFSRVSFQGPKEPVLKVTDQVSQIFNKSDVGEKLVNALKKAKPLFQISEGEGQYVYAKAEKRSLKGGETDLRNLYSILLKVFEEEFGKYPEEVSLRSFLEEVNAYEIVSTNLESYPFITVRADKRKIKKMLSILKKIENHPVGKKLLEDMAVCQKELEIYDDKHAVGGGGYTGAKQPGERIFNGEGSDAYIRFRFDQPLMGAHLVWTTKNTKIPFTYIDNMFHELVHAKHLMCGTMSPFQSEAQAIEEENHFRANRDETKEWFPRDPSKYEEGEQVWFGHFLEN